LLRGPITEFPKFRGQSENVSFGRNVAVAGGRAVWSSPFRFNRKPENLQQIQSWTTSLAHDLIRGRYSPAKAGLIRGKLWVSIKGSIRPSTRGGKNQPRKTELRTKKKSRENRAQIQIQRERENKRAAHSEENYPWNCLRTCKQRKNQDSAKEHSQQARIFFVDLEVVEKSRRKAQTSGHKRKARGSSRR